jgi:hypothetical protein
LTTKQAELKKLLLQQLWVRQNKQRQLGYSATNIQSKDHCGYEAASVLPMD